MNSCNIIVHRIYELMQKKTLTPFFQERQALYHIWAGYI